MINMYQLFYLLGRLSRFPGAWTHPRPWRQGREETLQKRESGTIGKQTCESRDQLAGNGSKGLAYSFPAICLTDRSEAEAVQNFLCKGLWDHKQT